MSFFTQAPNAFRSTVNRVGKFYNSTAAARGKAMSFVSANKGVLGMGAAAGALVGYMAHYQGTPEGRRARAAAMRFQYR